MFCKRQVLDICTLMLNTTEICLVLLHLVFKDHFDILSQFGACVFQLYNLRESLESRLAKV